MTVRYAHLGPDQKREAVAMLCRRREEAPAAAFQRLVHVPSRSAAPWLAGPFVGAPELSPERIAVAVGVSARYLHDVFQDSGRTVSETLLKLRLEKRHKDLADPQLAPYSIKAIAFRNGFKNQSHFACAFKAEYSHTPTQARELAWAGQPLPEHRSI